MKSMIFIVLVAAATADVVVFDVRDPPSPDTYSNIRQQQPVFEHTSAHAGAMPLARLLVSCSMSAFEYEINAKFTYQATSDDPEDGYHRLTQFDEEPQLHEKVMLAELKANPDDQQRQEQVRDHEPPVSQQKVERAPVRDSVKRKKLEIPLMPPKPQPQAARMKAPQSAPLVSNRYLGIGRRDPNEEVFPSEFLRERSAKLRRQEEYDRIQMQNPSGRWYFFVPASPVTVGDH